MLLKKRLLDVLALKVIGVFELVSALTAHGTRPPTKITSSETEVSFYKFHAAPSIALPHQDSNQDRQIQSL